jgi:hypothetical protein
MVRLAAEVCTSDPDLQVIRLAHCLTGNMSMKLFRVCDFTYVMLAIDPPH